MQPYDKENEVLLSKTQRKKNMLELQKLGEALLKLSPSALEKIALPPVLLEAVLFAQTLHAHEAIRRQLQYIGKLMRKIDAEPIKHALQDLQLQHETKTIFFHEVEHWRDRLIAEGDPALQLFLVEYPNAEKQRLRQLIRKSQLDQRQEKNSGSSRELFRYLKEMMMTQQSQ